ncbi:MAG: permease [Candidatus Peregrinibacteria bacterium]
MSEPLASSLHFFIDDTVKIFLLLLLITHVASLLRYYLPVSALRDFLASHRFYGADYFLASLFGAVTPFCSCSSIPLFIGFLEAGIPLGVTFAFLITSPLINEVAVALFVGLFGWKVTLFYVAAGLGIGMAGGYVLGKLRMERYVEPFVRQACCDKSAAGPAVRGSFLSVLKIVSRGAFKIVRRVGPYVLLGVFIGALIHGFVPAGFFEEYLSKNNLFAVPAAVIMGVPLYSNATGMIPIVQSLVSKGVALGTALAFMMAVVGLSLPEAIILKKVMKPRLLGAFFGIVTLGIIGIGYLFNVFL